jgi:hypothetical protein
MTMVQQTTSTQPAQHKGRITALQHDLMEGDYIVVSRYTDTTCYRTKWVKVTEVRPFAIKVQMGKYLEAWLPRRALVIDELYYLPHHLRLASWFKPNNGYNVIENLGEIYPY